MTIDQAIEVFVRGFCFTRGISHPFHAEMVEGAWRMFDAERRSGDFRTEEFVARAVPPARLDALARDTSRGRYSLCVIRVVGEDDRPIRAEYRALGYRLITTEPLMVHSLENIAPARSALPVIRVRTIEEADRLARATRRRQILPRHLAADPPPMRQYMSVDGDRPVGWVASIAAAEAAWCSNLQVAAAYRRRGIATALVTRMLQDDREAGASASVLLASHTGALLYPGLGYEKIGELLLFARPRR